MINDILQIEYLVVKYTEDDNKVLLSLRQAEILDALACDAELAKRGGCTAEKQDAALKQSQ
jgi:glutamate--cysteine ligase catalytic subunit